MKARKNRTTFYINNFIKGKYPREGGSIEEERRFLRNERIEKI